MAEDKASSPQGAQEDPVSGEATPLPDEMPIQAADTDDGYSPAADDGDSPADPVETPDEELIDEAENGIDEVEDGVAEAVEDAQSIDQTQAETADAQVEVADAQTEVADAQTEVADEATKEAPEAPATLAPKASRRPTKKGTPLGNSESPTPEKEPAEPSAEKPVRDGDSKDIAPHASGKNRPTRTRAEATRSDAPKKTGPREFLSQIVQELKKVSWPTGAQLVVFFLVVLFFVLFMIAFIGLLDFFFGWLMLQLFG